MATAALEVASAVAELDPTGISSNILSLASKINEQYGQMKDNQEVCLGLKREVNLISAIVEKLFAMKQTGPCEKTLIEVQACLTQCLTLIESIGAQKDTLGKIKAFMSAKGNKEVITKLTTQLHSISDILNLALTAQAANSIEEVRNLIQQKEIKSDILDLASTAQSANSIEEVRTLIKQKESEILPAIQQTQTEINEGVTKLAQQITQITVTATNAQVGNNNQQTNNAGGAGGTANVSNNIYVQTPSSSSGERRSSISLGAEIKHMAQEKDKHVLESLKQLFRDGRGEGPGKQTHAFDIYNEILAKHNAALAYKKGKDIHVLYVDDKPIRGEEETLAEISKMIRSLTLSPTAKAQNVPAVEVTNKRRGSGPINLADKKTDNEKAHHVLEELKAFFLEERDEGEKTENYAIYNEYLKKAHRNARLVYQQTKNKHVLYVNDEGLNTENAAKELSKIIQSLPPLSGLTPVNQTEMSKKADLSNPPAYAAPEVPVEVVRKRRESNLINLADIKTDNEKVQHVLEELRAFFLEERDTGDKTENYAIYNEYLKKAHKNSRIVYKPTQNKHVFYVNDAPLDAENAAKEISKMLQSLTAPTMLTQFNSIAKPAPQLNENELKQLQELLRLTAEGEQDKAETMLKKNPALALASGDVTDLSKRTFKGITAFQYALWALDWHMWTMLLKYIPQKDVSEQIAQSERGLWVPQHGITANWRT